MRKVMMAGNWKMHMTNGEAFEFFDSFIKEACVGRKLSERVDILFAVPFTLLQKSQEVTKSYGIHIAAQNIHQEASGAYTGEISTAMLKDIGISATLIGHSERRQYFGETDETVAAKTKTAQAAGIKSVVCVGEQLADREAGKTMDVITQQIKTALFGLENLSNVVVAYEPVWAIGTGKTATPEMAQEVHAHIRQLIGGEFGAATAEKTQILYGGSAKPSNIKELLAQPDIDGGLVGGASLKPGDFAQMIALSV